MTTASSTQAKWPKVLPPLTAEQREISNDFMKLWHEVLPKKFGLIERFNQEYVVKNAPSDFATTLEIGAGLGEHLAHEKLTGAQEAGYVALELRENMVAEIRRRFPRVRAVQGDCQAALPFPDGHFQRILAVHVLEHLPDLPGCIREMHRLCDKKRGVFSIVIPCEGSAAYTLARRISAQRIFEKRYKQSYHWFISREHINLPDEIVEELSRYFIVEKKSFFPLPLPFYFCNLCVGITCRPRQDVTNS